ncbi:MAG: LytTR family DNA-binding domain-containing protein [Prolixibacteraceae bacterium]|jgi:two-component system LytT family response regulator
MNNHEIFALIIESEVDSLNRAVAIFRANPLISGIETAADSDQAILKMISFNPDIVLFEYPPKGNSGKDLLKFIQAKLTETTIIIVSETKDYAATVIRKGIFNYLLKPVSKDDLDKIISKVNLIKQTNVQSRINEIIENTQEETRLKFQTTKGYLIVDPEEILYCKADGSCTEIHLTNERTELIFLFLRKLDEILRQFNFLRVSRSYLINQKFIRKIYRSNNTIILSSNGKEYEVKASKQQIKNLINFDSE